MDPSAGNFHLAPTSGAIDAGTGLLGSWCLEPQPNGGALNIGLYGGTNEATVGEGATDGNCP